MTYSNLPDYCTDPQGTADRRMFDRSGRRLSAMTLRRLLPGAVSPAHWLLEHE